MRRRDRLPTRLAPLWALLLLGSSVAQGGTDDESEKRRATLRTQAENMSVSLDQREQSALELMTLLDQAAHQATTAPERRKHWTEAINLVDRFEKANPGHPQTHQFQFQAAVYLWARGRLWADQATLAPGDHESHEAAVENFNVAIARLRTLTGALREAEKVLAENARFRLAQALTDRARLDPKDDKEREKRFQEADALLQKPIEEPALRGFAALLHAEVLGALGDELGAEKAIESAEKGSHSPPAAALLETKVAIQTAGAHFDKALKSIEAATVDDDAKTLFRVRTRLAQRAQLAPGPDRTEVEKALFEAARPLKEATSATARIALLELGQGIQKPDKALPPEAWDLLAQAALAAGQLDRAHALEASGADRAQAIGQPQQAATLRLRAGASLFRAEKFLEADAMLSRVADAPPAEAGDARVKAGHLRILARARALAAKRPGVTQADYAAALKSQVANFPEDPSAQEARWLLGKFYLATAKPAEALALWTEIPRSSPRWLESRLAIADHRQQGLDSQRVSNDRKLVGERYNEARNFLNAAVAQCRTDTERAAINLARARLELTPEVGQADVARQLCESIQRSSSQADQRNQARRYHIVAAAQLNHFLEAEKAARAETTLSQPAALLEIVRLLDMLASEAPSDLRVRRFGLILRPLLARVLENPDTLSPAELGEARLRQTRALLFVGDDVRARASITSDWANPASLDDRTLRDMADTYVRLSAYSLAADVQRLRSKQAPTGSPAWFDSRYGLALADYRAGKSREAAKLIDATVILHPDLGGGELRDKFIHLRQRLNPDSQ